jgi:hypothetical protein
MFVYIWSFTNWDNECVIPFRSRRSATIRRYRYRRAAWEDEHWFTLHICPSTTGALQIQTMMMSCMVLNLGRVSGSVANGNFVRMLSDETSNNYGIF